MAAALHAPSERFGGVPNVSLDQRTAVPLDKTGVGTTPVQNNDTVPFSTQQLDETRAEPSSPVPPVTKTRMPSRPSPTSTTGQKCLRVVLENAHDLRMHGVFIERTHTFVVVDV